MGGSRTVLGAIRSLADHRLASLELPLRSRCASVSAFSVKTSEADRAPVTLPTTQYFLRYGFQIYCLFERKLAGDWYRIAALPALALAAYAALPQRETSSLLATAIRPVP